MSARRGASRQRKGLRMVGESEHTEKGGVVFALEGVIGDERAVIELKIENLGLQMRLRVIDSLSFFLTFR